MEGDGQMDVFVVCIAAASCQKTEINRISLEIDFYCSGTCPASAEDQ